MAGHTDSVFAVAYSKDGRWIASGGADKTARIWDAHSGAPVRVLTGHDDYVSSVAFNPDGSLLATAGRDGSIRLWKTATGERVGEPIRGHDGKWVSVVRFSPDGALLASAGLDGTVRLWGMDARQPREQLLATHRGPVAGMAFSPDGRRIASAGYVYNFAVAGGEGPGTVRENFRASELRITEVDSHRPVVDGRTEFGYGALGLAFSPDGKRVAVGGDDKSIRLFDAETSAPAGAPLTGDPQTASGLAYSVDGTRIISGSDNTLHVWAADPNRSVGKQLAIFALSGLNAVSPDGSTIAMRDSDNASDIALWRADTGERVRTIKTGHAKGITALAWRPDGQAIAAGDAEDNTVNIWTAQSGARVGSPLTGATNLIGALSFSQDGRRIAAGCFGGSVWLWDTAQNPPRRQQLTGNAGDVQIVGFSADGHRLMAASQAHLASGDTGTLNRESIFKSNEGLTASSVRVWNADTGELAGKPLTGKGARTDEGGRPGDDAPILAAAISPDGHRILVNRGTELRLRDVATGQPVREPWVATGPSTGSAVAFSSDGRNVVSADAATANIQLWETASGRPIGPPLQGHIAAVLTVAFGAGDRFIISRGVDGLIRWPGPSRWPDELCGKLTANMTKSEWADWVSPKIPYTPACRSLTGP